MSTEKIIVSQNEYNAFMRWLFARHQVKNFSQFHRRGWRVTAVFVDEVFCEVLYEKGAYRCVNQRLFEAWKKDTTPCLRLHPRGEETLAAA